MQKEYFGIKIRAVCRWIYIYSWLHWASQTTIRLLAVIISGLNAVFFHRKVWTSLHVFLILPHIHIFIFINIFNQGWFSVISCIHLTPPLPEGVKLLLPDGFCWFTFKRFSLKFYGSISKTKVLSCCVCSSSSVSATSQPYYCILAFSSGLYRMVSS